MKLQAIIEIIIFLKKPLKISWVNTFVTVYVFTQPLCMNRMWNKVNFWVELNRFEFRAFLLLDWLS